MDLEKVIIEGEKHAASDILLSSGSLPAVRESGQIRFIGTERLVSNDVEAMLREMIDDDLWQRFVSTRELDFPATFMGHRMRGNAYWRDGAPAVALRLIPHAIPTPEQLGLPPVLVDLVSEPQGLILFTGAAGQGKTTTQAALLNHLNQKSSRHVITVEDPIEFVHTSHRSIIDQREVGADTVSFSEALRHAMRQNPDILLVGEMRDYETMRAALFVAETGHLVLSTLHANDACQAIDRIVHGFPEGNQQEARAQLAMVLLAVVNQRLIRGRTGRLVLAVEILRNNAAVSRLIREGKSEQLYGAIELDQQHGMQTMNRSIEALVRKGTVNVLEAQRFLSRKESHGRES